MAFDEGKVNYSVLLNQAIDIFGIHRNLLIIGANYLLMPDTITGIELFSNNFQRKSSEFILQGHHPDTKSNYPKKPQILEHYL